MNLQIVIDEMKKLLGGDGDGHGYEHTMRVYANAMQLCESEKCDRETVAVAALLHDCDDYKLFGEESAATLANAGRIMTLAGVTAAEQDKVCAIINNMGYSKLLTGIRPATMEGKIVSDADMLDAMGAMAIIRTLSYTLSKGSKVVFDRNIFPARNLSAADYKSKKRIGDSFVNHFFDKNLKLKNLLFTESARAEAARRHRFMVDFLREFFYEQGCADWINFLEQFNRQQCAA